VTRRGEDLLDRAALAAGQAPPLLLEAQRVAQSVRRGVHGRRRTGQGETFWQFREYRPGDSSRDIDWRQTARRDDVFVREMEWEAAQTLWLYRDGSASMDFRSARGLPSKKDYAATLLLALAVLALDGGEQVGLLNANLAPQGHPGAIFRIFGHLDAQRGLDGAGPPVQAHAQMVLLSDFFMPIDQLRAFCAAQAARGVRLLLVQITDPAEEALPYKGRVRFEDAEDAGESLTVPQVESIRAAYREKFEAHRAAVAQVAASCGGRFMALSTAEKPEAALFSLYDTLSARRKG
jgi:uncharacterized protein (DUF58 family)